MAHEDCTLTPSVPITEYADSYGNLCERLIAPPGEFSIRRSADVSTADGIDVSPGAPFNEVHSLPDEVLTYLLPSRYCESDRFTDLGRELVDGVEPGYDQVARIVGWIRPPCASIQILAISDVGSRVNQQREGVCRELAHLGIALSRSLCIPARIVVGYLHELEPMDFHAWFEAYVGGRWYTFDATQALPRGGRVAVAYGRDAGRRGDIQPVWPGAISQSNGGTGRDARRSPEEQLRIHCRPSAIMGLR